LERLAQHYANGAKKYAEHNWAKGIPYSHCMDSLMRHVIAYMKCDKTEDHLAAIAWNAFTIMDFEERNMHFLNDLFDFTPKDSEERNDG
jgi:hypothetical protein